MTTAIVCGGRDYTSREAVFATLDAVRLYRHVTAIVHGGAPGADELAHEWAKRRGVERTVYPADWKRLGKAAGPRRNQYMLEDSGAQLVVAFPGGRGTADMVRRARAMGLPVVEVPR